MTRKKKWSGNAVAFKAPTLARLSADMDAAGVDLDVFREDLDAGLLWGYLRVRQPQALTAAELEKIEGWHDLRPLARDAVARRLADFHARRARIEAMFPDRYRKVSPEFVGLFDNL